jgi:HK97 family phage prohead protease
MDGGSIRSRSGALVTRTAKAEPTGARSFTFVASSNTVDRYGDIIEQDWILDDYWKNPVLLWAHNSRLPPIGKVTAFDVTSDRTRTIAKAELLPEGLDPFTDQLAKLVDGGHLRAVSVGFLPGSESDRRDEKGNWAGYVYSQNKLVELSLVSVPANPDAVQLARSLGIPAEHLRAIFEPTDAIEPAASGLSARQRRAYLADVELQRIRTRNFGRRIGHGS